MMRKAWSIALLLVPLATFIFSGAAFAQSPPVDPDDDPSPPSLSSPGGGPPLSQASAERAAPEATAETSARPSSGEEAAPDGRSFVPSLNGPIGLFQVSTAEVGPAGHLRLGLHGQFFRASSFLVEGSDRQGDVNTRLMGTLAFGYTPHEAIEIFGSIGTSSNRNRRAPELDRRDPELIKSFGDLTVGGKGILPVIPGFTAGAELGFRFLSSISDLSFSPSSTSLWIGPVATYDLRARTRAPLRFHANANFYLDNSSNLHDFSDTSLFTRQVAMFAYGIAGSRVRFALGADALLAERALPIPIQPFVEYHAEIVTASADPAFKDFTNPNNRDQHWMTFGLRARARSGLTLALGTNVALRSVGYQYGPPLPPYDVIFGLAVPMDLGAMRRPTVVTKTVEAPTRQTMGTVVGTIKTGKEGKAIPDAIVAFGERLRSRVATDPDGGYQSGLLSPGTIEVVAAAPGYEPAKGTAVVVAGSAATLDLVLTPKVVSGNVRGKVADRDGTGLPATIRFVGASVFETQADSGGAFSAALPAGPYRVVVESPGRASKEVPLDVVAGQDRQLEVTLRAPNPDVTLTPQAIVLRAPIKFRPGAPKLDAKARAQLDGVADVLLDHPEIKTLRVEAHWSGPPSSTSAKKLTERQAAAIKEHLVARGVSADRIDAVGFGGASPVVPNLGPKNQAKNRRLELVVVR